MNYPAYGTTICDMHDGLNFDRLGPHCNFRITNRVKLRVENGSEIIESMVREQLDDPHWKYLNKLLVVVDENWTDQRGVVLAYSYDARWLEFLTVVEN